MLYIIRHTKPEVARGTCYGQTDLDTASSFYSEAKVVKQKLQEIAIDDIYSSPLLRCKKLATYIAPESIEIKFDNRLKELNFGRWEGKKWEYIPKWEMELWGENYISNSVHGGETFLELQERVLEFVLNLDSSKTTVIVAHDGVIRALLAEYLTLGRDRIFSIELPYGSVVRVTPQQGEYVKVAFL